MSAPLTSIRRYPVKAMGGEALRTVVLDARGLAGDRWYAVVDADGRFASGKDSRRFRRRDAVFDHRAESLPDGVHVVGPGGSWAVGDPALDVALSAALSAQVQVRPEVTVPHQDAGAVSLIGSATLAWCAERWDLDADPRRLRVNLVVDTAEPFEEESWVGSQVELGEARLQVVTRIERCRTVDVVQDGSTARGRWLKPLAAERERCVAVYADVVRPGTIRLGDLLVGT